METADLSEDGTQGLEMKGDREMPASCVFKKPTYLNIYGSTRKQHNSLMCSPEIVNNSLSQRKVSICIAVKGRSNVSCQWLQFFLIAAFHSFFFFFY